MSICLPCWEEATRRHLLHCEGRSVTEVYGRLAHAKWCVTQGGEIDLMKALGHSLQTDAPRPVEDPQGGPSGAEDGPSPATNQGGE